MKKKNEILKFSEIVLYVESNGEFQIALNKDSDSIWLNINQLAQLYQSTKQNISLHIHKILAEEELSQEATVKYYLTVQDEQNRQVHRNIAYYNLEMILSIGYRVRSQRGTQFRIGLLRT